MGVSYLCNTVICKHRKSEFYPVKIGGKTPGYMASSCNDSECFMKFGHISNTIEFDTNTLIHSYL